MSNNYRELTGREKQRIKKLVTSLCANYDKEYGCLRYRGPRKVIRLFGERRSNGAGGFWRQRRRRSQSEVCDDEVPSEKQTGAGRRVQAPHGGARGKAGTGKG